MQFLFCCGFVASIYFICLYYSLGPHGKWTQNGQSSFSVDSLYLVNLLKSIINPHQGSFSSNYVRIRIGEFQISSNWLWLKKELFLVFLFSFYSLLYLFIFLQWMHINFSSPTYSQSLYLPRGRNDCIYVIELSL